MKSDYKTLGQFIRPLSIKNKDLAISLLLGVSITKKFIISIANTVGTDFSNYKIVKQNQFAYGPVTSRNGEKISVALLEEPECIISSSYTVFEVIDQSILLPEYLMMWFTRPEFDRYARYKSHGSVREMFSWEDMCNVELPVPDIEKQKAIVKAYQVVTDRIALKEKINGKLEDMISIVFDNLFETKDNVSKKIKLSDIVEIIDNRGKTPPNSREKTYFPLIEIASLKTTGRIITYPNCSKYVTKEIYDTWFRSGHPLKKDILISTVGSLAEMKLYWSEKGAIAQNIVAFRCINESHSLYLYQYLINNKNDLMSFEMGSVQASIKVSQIVTYDVTIPDDSELITFNNIATKLTEKIANNEKDIEQCLNIQTLLLSRLATE